MIYFDNAATTFPKPESVYEAMDKTNRTLAVNAGRGSYKAAREATILIDDTKTKLLDLFHVTTGYAVAFTPSVTHAINQILWGLNLSEGDIVYLSPYEHNAVERTIEHIRQKSNIEVKILPVKGDCSIDIEQTRYLFAKDKPRLTIVTAISNVTGYMLPYNEIFEIAKSFNSESVTLLDASQAAGLLDINLEKDYVDILAFAGHKTLYGPFGIAGFVINDEVYLDVTLTGGNGSDSLNLDMPSVSPQRYEASSTNIVAIAGLNAALNEINVSEHYDKLEKLTTYFINQIKHLSKVNMLGVIEGSNIGIVSVVVDGYSSQDVGTILDEEYDIAVRTGYHCAPRIHSLLEEFEHEGSIRVGFGIHNTLKEVDLLVNALKSL